MTASTLLRIAVEQSRQRGERLDPQAGRLAMDIVHQVLAVRRTRGLGDRELAYLCEALDVRLEVDAETVRQLVDLVGSSHSRGTVRPEERRVLALHYGEEIARAAMKGAENPGDLAEFVARHGVTEALLLLDILVQVSVADGTVDAAELSQLDDAARQLGVDPLFVSALLTKHDPRMGSAGRSVTLSGTRVRIGRSPTNDLVLPDPQVAARHAELVRVPGGWRVVAVGKRPVILDGRAVRAAPVAHGGRIRLGPYALTVVGDTAVLSDERSFTGLSVRELTRRIGDTTLLDKVSFTAFSGELIAVVGPSGSGKTTLLTALSGAAPADAGSVWFDQDELPRLLAADPSLVGEVPQDDIVLPELTVEENLRASARLRFSADVTDAEIDAAVEAVLVELGIDHIRDARVGDADHRGISGGQRKRVNLGQELLTRSTRLLFLDEPLSGLDPAASHDIVDLLRRLADQGRIVLLVTHDLSAPVMAQVDQLLVLAQGGRLAWFGPPEEALGWFELPGATAIMDKLETAPPEVWQQRFAASMGARRYITTREHLLHLDLDPAAGTETSRRRRHVKRGVMRTLTRRYARVKLRDRTGMLVFVAQPLLLGLAMAMAFSHVTTSLVFMLALSQLWFGLFAAVRELHSDRSVWRRERRVGVGVFPYLASKVVVLGVLSSIQAATLALITWASTGMAAHGFSLLALVGTGVLVAQVGVSLGLLVSALLRSSVAAVGALVLALVPQFVFSGIMIPLPDARAPARVLSHITVQRYALDATLKCGDTVAYNSPFARVGWTVRPVRGELRNLGLRSVSDDPVQAQQDEQAEVDAMLAGFVLHDDDGLSRQALALILLAFTLAHLGLAGLLVWRRHRPRRS